MNENDEILDYEEVESENEWFIEGIKGEINPKIIIKNSKNNYE